MKKVLFLTTVLVLTVSLLTGCGCTRRGAGMDTTPSTEMTILPTNIPETTAPLLPETEPPTIPMTEAPSESPMDESTGSDSSIGGNSENGGSSNGGESGTASGSAATEGARNRMR